MAFKPLPKPQRHGRAPRTTPGIHVKNGITLISMPKDVLKQANLLGLTTTKVNLLIGEGSDAGSFALVAGSDYSLAPYGSKNLLKLSTRMLGDADFKTSDCTFEVGNGHLVVTPPKSFPWAKISEIAPEPTADVRAWNGLGATREHAAA